MCEECKRLDENAEEAEAEAGLAQYRRDFAEMELSEAEDKVDEIQAEQKEHRESCAGHFDDWEYHQAAETAGQTSLLGTGEGAP